MWGDPTCSKKLIIVRLLRTSIYFLYNFVIGRAFCVFDILLQHPDPTERMSPPGDRAQGPVASSDGGHRRLHVHRPNEHRSRGNTTKHFFLLQLTYLI
jgi:hypothetical protein